MSYSIIPTRRFEKELKRLAKKFVSIKSDFSELVKRVSAHPESGIPLGNNCYKVRLAIKSKGKGKNGGQESLATYMFKAKRSICLPFTIKAKNLI